MACLCLGPVGSGKTLLLKRLTSPSVKDVTSTVETVGTNIVTVQEVEVKEKKDRRNPVEVREVGGSMAPIWTSYFPSNAVMYVVDSSNLFQISIATVFLMELISHEKLKDAQFLVVLTKKDLTNREKLNYLKFMMRLENIVGLMKKRVKVEEVSPMTGEGIENLRNWILENGNPKKRIGRKNRR